jgi:hypothetical protein
LKIFIIPKSLNCLLTLKRYTKRLNKRRRFSKKKLIRAEKL